MEQINSYELSRKWFDWCFENPEKISPNHSAIYFFAIEHCNRLGWRNKFGFPTQMVMDAIGIKKHQTYIRYFNDLVEWGFFELVQKSMNQYSSNIISLSSAKPKSGKALDKAIINHEAKQIETIGQSNSSIDKPITNKQITNKKQLFKDSIYFDTHKFKEALPDWSNEKLRYYYDSLLAWSNEGNKKIDWIATAKVWERKDRIEKKINFDAPVVKLPDWRSGRFRLSEEQYQTLTVVQKREYNQIISGV